MTNPVKPELTNHTIASFLRSIGFRGTYLGFHYLVCAISLVVSDKSYLTSLTTQLYPYVAGLYGASAASVEKAMRFAISTFWDYGNVALLEAKLGYPLLVRPSAGEFIDIVSSLF